MNFIANLLTIQPVKELYIWKLIKKRTLKKPTYDDWGGHGPVPLPPGTATVVLSMERPIIN